MLTWFLLLNVWLKYTHVGVAEEAISFDRDRDGGRSVSQEVRHSAQWIKTLQPQPDNGTPFILLPLSIVTHHQDRRM